MFHTVLLNRDLNGMYSKKSKEKTGEENKEKHYFTSTIILCLLHGFGKDYFLPLPKIHS